jgi:hypothetical protein
MIKNTVYLVKFDCGYYAKKQPNYHWSFTDDPYLATHYKTRKMAEERGVWAASLRGRAAGTTYTIEQYTLKTVLELNTEKESK